MSNGPEFIRSESLIDEPVPPVAAAADPYEVRVLQVREAAVVEPAVAAAPVVVAAAPVVVAAAPVVAAPSAVRTSYTRSFAPDAIVAALIGLAIMLVGLLAITRGGFDGSMEEPVVDVLGFTHTTLLGLIEVVIGGCLLISGATRSRSGALFFGSLLGIAAFVGAVQAESFDKSLALESGLAWLLLFAAVIVVLTALTLPRYLKRSTAVHPA